MQLQSHFPQADMVCYSSLCNSLALPSACGIWLCNITICNKRFAALALCSYIAISHKTMCCAIAPYVNLLTLQSACGKRLCNVTICNKRSVALALCRYIAISHKTIWRSIAHYVILQCYRALVANGYAT